MNKLLTISIISSGRADTIERCLESLSPIQNKIETELIITDTDASHRSDIRAIVERYADKVIDFKWCDDFSAARNVGMKAATGEWFLYIDDDEWIIDADPIIEFLESDSQKNHLVNIKVRNYSTQDFSKYSDRWVTRLVKRFDDTHFEGRIHEYLQPVTNGYTAINALLGHSGYVYDNELARDKHARRNIKLLKSELAVSPLDIRNWQHLLQEYDYTDNYEKQFEICDKVLDMYNSGTLEYDINSYCLFVAAKLRIYRKLEQWEEEKDLYESKYKAINLPEVVGAYIHLDMSLCYLNLDDYDNSVYHLRQYLSAYEKWHNRKDELSLELTYFLNETFDENLHDLALAIENTWNHRQPLSPAEIEMQQLAQQLLIKSDELRAAGYTAEADSIIQQIKAISPELIKR